jgi:hypothetical protein
MSLADAISKAGPIPPETSSRAVKKRYAETLSKCLAEELAEGLRQKGFTGTRPLAGGPGEKAFQGGLGPKKVDVAYSDERHGLLLAVSVKSIMAAPYGKNLKNRFADLCTEAITLHMRFPYAVVCAFFAFPEDARRDKTKKRRVATFDRAMQLLASVSGREEHTDPAEKFEDIAMLSVVPPSSAGKPGKVTIFDAVTGKALSEKAYYEKLRMIYNRRNPHGLIGEPEMDDA